MKIAHRTALALALTTLAPGCATLYSFPDCYGGTRTLFEDPFPLTEVQYPLGLPPRGVQLGPGGLIVANALWLLDLPLSFALDTALSPITVWTIPSELKEAERKEREREAQQSATEARQARFLAWEQDPALAARELSNQDSVGARGASGYWVSHPVGSDAATFLVELGPQALPWLPQVEAHLTRFVAPVADDTELSDRRCAARKALQVVASLGPDAAPAFPAVHAVLRSELERSDPSRMDVALCGALGRMGSAAAPATPELVRLLPDSKVHAEHALKAVIDDLAQGEPGAAAGLRTVLACDGLPEWLRSKAQRALTRLGRD